MPRRALDRLHLQGLGEPLLNPHFSEMVAYAASKGVEVTASSNLMLVDRERAVEIARKRPAMPACLRGRRVRPHLRVDKEGRFFSKLVGNVRLVMGRRKGPPHRFPSMRMTVVLMRRNLAELAGLVKLASDLGMEQVFVQRLCHSFREAALPARLRAHARPRRKRGRCRRPAGDGSRAVRGGPRHSRMAWRRASPSTLTR